MVKRRNQIIVCICFMLTCSFSFIRGNQTMFLGNYFNIIPFEFSLVSPLEFSPVPKAKDFYWKKIIPSTIREDYIKLGKQYQNQKWQPIPDALFADYKKTGNRKNYETPYFEKRRQLSCLVMAEIMDYQGIFLKDIDNGLKYFVSEPWWGIPAHYPTDYPDEKNQKVDLFNPETANLLAWTIYMLHDELETIDKGICDLIVNEIQRRVLIPARTVGYYWNRSLDNWNTWICSNLISCILFCESSRNQQIDDIKRVIDCLEYFIINYHGDGGCEEGIMYWDRAGASLYECVYLLDLATSHAISLRNDRKLKAIGKYAYKMYIGNKTYVNFADSHPFSGVHINILYPFGQYVNDSVMMKQAAFIAKENGYDKSPATAFRGSGNFPTLSRELMFLYQYESFSKTSAEEPLLRDTEFNELHVITARSNENSTKGLYIAAKGGNNNEYHNHNDVGNFVVYKDAEPIIIDIGVGTYTGQTFGEKRYENFINWDIAYMGDYNPVVKLKDGYLTSFTPSRDVTENARSILELANFCESLGIEFIYINLPNKICISQDKDISGILDFSNQNADKFLNMLKDFGVKYYDLRKNLHEQGMNHHESFFRTDHHWKPETGLWAAREILKFLRDDYNWPVNPEILRPENFESVIYHNWFLGSQGKKVTLIRTNPDDISLFYPKFETNFYYEIPQLKINTGGDFSITYDMKQIQSRDYYGLNAYAAYDYADRALIKFTNLLTGYEKKILFIHDSFSNCVIPFIALDVKNVIEIDLRHFTGSVKTFIKSERPDIVIVTYYATVPGRSSALTVSDTDKKFFDFR